jgi:hypothetical protein
MGLSFRMEKSTARLVFLEIPDQIAYLGLGLLFAVWHV